MGERLQRHSRFTRPVDEPTAEERLMAAIFGEKAFKSPEERARDRELAFQRGREFLAKELGRPLGEIPTDPDQVEELRREY